jgi:hypothetical protein
MSRLTHMRSVLLTLEAWTWIRYSNYHHDRCHSRHHCPPASAHQERCFKPSATDALSFNHVVTGTTRPWQGWRAAHTPSATCRSLAFLPDYSTTGVASTHAGVSYLDSAHQPGMATTPRNPPHISLLHNTSMDESPVSKR